MSRQAYILSFAVEKPRYVALHRPSLPVKRIPKRRPGRPRKKVALMTGESSGIRRRERAMPHHWSLWRLLREACGSHYANRAPARPKKFQATYTAERRFEIREFVLSHPELSYQRVADAFGMPKTMIFDIVKKDPTGEPVRGRGNKKGVGRPLSYSQEVEEQLVNFVNHW